MDKEIDVEHLAGLKSYLERRLKDLEEKVALYRGYIKAIDSVLTQTSFKVAADLLKEKPTTVQERGAEQETTKAGAKVSKIELTSRADGAKLGEANVTSTSVTIIPAQNVRSPADSGTFNAFFIRKILNGMIEKDEELIKTGKINGKEKMSYQITKNSDGTLKRITISNYRDENRLRQITTTIRWTLEKTSQKVTE